MGRSAVLGLSYKPKTDVVEESPAVYLVRELLSHDVDVVAYDPAGMENAKRDLDGAGRWADSAEACVRESDVVVLATPWQEFIELPIATFERDGTPRVVIDCWRALPREELERVAEYVALGEGRSKASVALG